MSIEQVVKFEGVTWWIFFFILKKYGWFLKLLKKSTRRAYAQRASINVWKVIKNNMNDNVIWTSFQA